MKPTLLQICPLPPSMVEALQRDYDLHRLPDGDAAEPWLAEHGAGMRGLVTGGHLGVPDALWDRLPALEVVGINGVGYDRVDLPRAQAIGVNVAVDPQPGFAGEPMAFDHRVAAAHFDKQLVYSAGSGDSHRAFSK